MHDGTNIFSPEELQNPFGVIKETDAGSVNHEDAEAKAFGDTRSSGGFRTNPPSQILIR
jgi:hypothetical protein